MAGADEFLARIDELQANVGSGMLTGRVVVDQAYAQNQHESVWFRHPRGGQAKYLETPLLGEAARYMEHLATHVLEGRLEDAMRDNVEDLSGTQLPRYAPVDHGYLRQSGHPIVESDGAVVYDRPPVQGRLSEEELNR